MLRILSEFHPTTVVGCLGTDSYEVLRYVPAGVRRVAMIQADAPIFYEGVRRYGGSLDDIVGVSASITEHLTRMDVFRNVSKRYLPYGVVMPEHVEPRGTGGLPLRILYVGRITNGQKRVHLFPKIMAALKDAGIPFQWTIAGEGDQRVNLERLMASNDPEHRVVFPGPLPNGEVPALLERHDIFLLASDAEGLPVSLLEAMGHGLVPVVSALESGVREVVDKDNGVPVAVDDLDGYARGIIHLHKNRAEMTAKSVAARERVRVNYSVEAMTDRWLNVLSEPAEQIADWPARWDIKIPLVARNPLYFSPPVRMMRRLVRKLFRQ